MEPPATLPILYAILLAVTIILIVALFQLRPRAIWAMAAFSTLVIALSANRLATAIAAQDAPPVPIAFSSLVVVFHGLTIWYLTRTPFRDHCRMFRRQKEEEAMRRQAAKAMGKSFKMK